ncbi:hypothetical protein ACN47E_004987 [Coniothyrium glycines]
MESLNLPLDLSELQSQLHPLLKTISTTPFLQNVKPSSTADGVAVLLFLLASFGYITRGRLWDKADPNHYVYFERPQVSGGSSGSSAAATRDISQRLAEDGYQCVIFWGSQSGTSERLAESLGKECHTHFGINALVADLSDYDAESIAKIQQTHFAVFIVSTYGEGDPSDNTAGLWDWVKRIQEDGTKLNHLRYFAFGLGNSNYKYYNRVLDVVADAFDAAGAASLMPRQRADDANGGTEEDFQAWKDDVFSLFRSMGYEQKTVAYQPTIDVAFAPADLNDNSICVTGPAHHQKSGTQSAVLPLIVRNAHELFTAGDRNCIHMEFDLGNNDMVYKTGDHIGIWPINPEEEVDRLVKVLGWQDRRHERLVLTSATDSAKLKIPSPTTLETIFRNHLEICGPMARKVVLDMAQFAPTAGAKAMLLELAQDRERYEQFNSTTHITLARLLTLASPHEPWATLPLSFIIESLHSLQPRYYSISSSSVISPRRIAITALVVNKPIAGPGQETSMIQGLTSNYLLSASNLPSSAGVPTPTYQRSGNMGDVAGTKVLAHVRKSKFKLPITASTQIIMVSAGTGFAPFRAFLQERAKLSALGKPVGKMLLFFGCRNQDDYIYRDEIAKIQEQLGDKLEVVTAFSRDAQQSRVYVQDRVGQRAAQVLEMLEAGANMYICGKASMAREVDMKLEEAVKVKKNLGENEVKAWADGLKKKGKWRADVWG